MSVWHILVHNLFAVVTQYAVGDLQRDVCAYDLSEVSCALHMVEKSVSVFFYGFVKQLFSLVSERAMSQIVGERNGFYQVAIEPQRSAYRTGYSRDKLDVVSPCGNIVVVLETENLRFAGVSVEKLKIYYSFAVSDILPSEYLGSIFFLMQSLSFAA